jgi:hypothetical protein
MSDRVLVMREGRQMAVFDRREATQERVLSAAMGQPGDLFPDDEIDHEAAAEALRVMESLITSDSLEQERP